MRLPAACLLLCAICATAIAAPAATTIVERRETMKSFAGAVRTNGEMFSSKRPYESRLFKAAAERIRMDSGAALRQRFPAGSVGEGSQAKPEIFTDWPEFTVLSDQLELLAAALSSAADRSPNEISSAMRMRTGMTMGGSLLASRAKPLTKAEIAAMPAEHAFHMLVEQCTACHAKFRFRDE